jgi:hypothetical protein
MGKPRQGETIHGTLVSGASGNVNLYDASGNARTIQPWEQVILDSVSWAFEPTGSSSVSFLADSNANTVALVALVGNASTATGTSGGFSEFPSEGISLSVGGVPYVSNGGGGLLTTITARVINGKSQGVRPNYRELLTPNGNIGGQ